MNKKNLIFLVFCMFSAGIVSANTNWYSAVDSREIRWSGSTTYSTAWYAGIYTWNQLGKINIAPDTWLTVADLKISDINTNDGKWLNNVGAYAPILNGAD